MTDPQSIMRYQEQIGWIGEKSTRFATMTRTFSPRLSNIGHPPQETWDLVRSAIQLQGLSFVELARQKWRDNQGREIRWIQPAHQPQPAAHAPSKLCRGAG